MLVLRGGRVWSPDGWSERDLLLDGARIALAVTSECLAGQGIEPAEVAGTSEPDGSGANPGPAREADRLAAAASRRAEVEVLDVTGCGRAEVEVLDVTGCGRAEVEVLDVTGCLVVPGFVDLHVHGAGGFAVQGPDADLAGVSRALAAHGVTAFLATTFAAPLTELAELVGGPRPTGGARCLGVHLEGPWLSPGAAGAQPPGALRSPDVAEALALLDAGDVRVVTLAPELPGAPELVAALVARGVRVSLGHSTASFREATLALDAGASGVTHCFNAMSQLSSREPGLVGAALTHPDIVVEVIADGVHVHPAGVLALYAARGATGVALVSDCVDGCAPEGALVRDGDVLRLPDGTLAGSALSLDAAVRNLVTWGVPVEDALVMASVTPARALGLDVALRPGGMADVVVLDADLRVRHTFVAGVLQ